MSENHLAHGSERLDVDVAERLRQVEEAEATGTNAERAQAYAALGRAAAKVARALERG